MSLRPLIFFVLLQAVLSCGSAYGHKFEDGYVERTLSVRIRDASGRIEMAIGLNDATLLTFLKEWPNDPELFRQAMAPSAEQGNPPVSAEAIDAPEEGDLNNELELILKFGEVAGPNLTSGLHATCNGQPLALTLVSAKPSPRHHATLLVTWQFQLPEVQTIDLEICDGNFLQQPGGVRYSLKTSGTAMLLQSNVAPILIRSKRVDLTGLSVDQRLGQCRLQTKIRQFSDQKTLKKTGDPPTSSGSERN